MLQKTENNSDWIEPCNDQCSFCFLNYVDILAENFLFRGLSRTELGQIIKDIHHQVKRCNKNEVIAQEGEIWDKLMIIVKGSVVGEMMDFEGRVLRIESRKSPETVATAFIFGSNNRLPVTITALEETRLLLIPKEEILQLFSDNKKVLNNFLDIMANRAQFLSNQLKLLGMNSIKGKIAHYLLEQMKKQNGEIITLPHSQTELSEMFGVARPSVARALKELNRSGYISSKGKKIEILNKAGLSTFLR